MLKLSSPRNSWAASWGEEGYIRVKTGENACGVAMEATIADASDETAGIKIDQRVIDVIQGLSEGFGLKMEEQCVNDSVTMIDDLEKAEKLIEKKTPIAMAEAMRLIATVGFFQQKPMGRMALFSVFHIYGVDKIV